MKSIENEWAQQETPLLDIEMRRTWLYHTSKWMTMLNIDTHTQWNMREKGPKCCAKQKKLTEHDENEGKTYKAKRDDGKCCGDWPTERKPRIWQAFNISLICCIYTALGKATTGNDGHIFHFATILFSFLKSDRHSKFRQSSSGSQDIEYRWAKLIYGPICILTWLCLHRNSCHTWVAGMTYLKRPSLEVPLRASWVVKPISKPWSQKAKW